MAIEIKNRYTERVVYSSATAKDLREAILEAISAKVSLEQTDLSYANLSYAKGVSPLVATPLLAMTRQPGIQRWFKIVSRSYESPMYNQCSPVLNYKVGNQLEVPGADTDPAVNCGAGINVGTLDWLYWEYKLFMQDNRDLYRLLAIDCKAADIACIPTGTTGKIRLKKGTVFAELNMDEVYGKIEKKTEATK